MTTYTSNGFRSIAQDHEIMTVKDAAKIFADRQAKRDFGNRGYCRTIRADSWSMDNTSHEFEAFIGTDDKNGSCSGHNFRFTVRVEQ